MSTAAVIIIGNEILSGKFQDENGTYAIERFRTLGIDLCRVVYVQDDVQAIAAEVRRCAESCDAVFTSGGVGPTHDDVTMEAIGVSFGLPLELRSELVDVIDRYGLSRDPATLRMATVPAGAVLVDRAEVSFPVIKVRNVYVLPGIPSLFREKLEAVIGRYSGPAICSTRVFTNERETAIAERLTAIVARHPEVAIGSYPRFGEGPFRVIVTLESTEPAALERARREVVDTLLVVDIEEP